MKELLLVTPPFTQLNTPYPATAYLKGFLNTKGISSFQMDLGMEVILSIFSKEGLTKLFDYAAQNDSIIHPNSRRIFELRKEYINSIESVIEFLQGNNQTLARQINSLNFLPQASRFETLEDLDWAFGNMGIQDQAKHLATLYLEDISDFIVDAVDENFGFSRYAEKLGRSANSFDELHTSLSQVPTYIDLITLDIFAKQIKRTQPKLVCFSVPFPGNLYSAFRCAQWIKRNHPTIKIAMGGGFPNTELRSLKEKRVFDYFDFITLDDGELPIELLHKSINSESPKTFKRTFILENGEVCYKNDSLQPDYKQARVGTPDYSDLLLDQYISVIEIANPMHSLWTDGRWNKLTMAHGCYWAKCSFCDVSLDYIKLYEPVTAKLLVDRMEEMITSTGENGFHFVDEAAPPALMRELALEIIRRELTVTWWTNIRFEKSFSKDLCRLLAASGCIAVSGGLEVASERLLKLIEKGVTVEQVAQVTRNLTESGVMVHAYLMYGYPTQTVQETIDSLEMVRQLFELGIIQSGFWHQFALTAHSPIGLNPKEYGITPQLEKIEFANNDVEFIDQTNIDHSKFNDGLKKSLYNFMHGVGFDLPLQSWFEFKVPTSTIHSLYIENCLAESFNLKLNLTSKIVFLGNLPTISEKGKKSLLMFQLKTISFEISLEKDKAYWLVEHLTFLCEKKAKTIKLQDLKINFETTFGDFEPFWFSTPINKLKANGLLVL
ncbi:MAG: hypothetical protein ACJAV5_000120 [Vicingaceae bacterium]